MTAQTKSHEPAITPELVAQHGLKPDEYERILKLIGREPSFTELGIFSAMWNEHCSYKSSRLHLHTLPTKAPWVIQGPGENAGIIDIGDGLACVFKMESHNHPSYIEPYQGATTGVGGILRDVFTMGARPIACLNLLRFGSVDHPRTRHLVSGVVAGIGGYGNSFGVPTVGGSTAFHSRYDGNILVNAMAVGLARTDKIFYAAASGVGMPIVYLGSKTGRDGIHGATMASAEFDANSDEKRPTVQVGDPFSEKLLLEACLEIMAKGCVIAIQDMGAAGLTSSAVEMGAKGDLGVELDLDKVPCRETGMTAYEMMLSESQERMLMVLNPDKEEEAEAIFRKWGLDFAVVGKTTPTRALRRQAWRRGQGRPADQGTGRRGAALRPAACRRRRSRRSSIPASLRARRCRSTHALEKLVACAGPALKALGLGAIRPSHSRQYACSARAATPPWCASTTARRAWRSPPTSRRAIATPIRSRAASRRWRKPGAIITAVGGTPLALTDNLNFGNPERPEIMGQFVGCLEGIGEACRALDFPIVSGNVSLYNETKARASCRPRRSAASALSRISPKRVGLAFRAPGEKILLIGETEGWLGQSIYLREILGREEGAPPPVDLAQERAQRRFRPRPDRATASSARRMTFPTAASPSRWPKWPWPAASARKSPRRAPMAPRSGSARIRAAICSRRRPTRPATSSPGPRRRACP